MNHVMCDSRSNSECYDIIAEPSNKGFLYIYSHKLNFINSNFYRRGASSIQMMNHSTRLFYQGLAFIEFSPFYEKFNTKIEEMISSGFTTKWRGEYLNPRNVYPYDDDLGPQVLTMDDLNIGFQLCCIPLALSVIAFAGEITVFWLMKMCSRIKEGIVASALVEAFLQRNH